MRRRFSLPLVPLLVGALLLGLAPSASASIRFVRQWGSQGTGNGQFMRPYGVATDSSDNVYVVEYDGARVDKFSSSGTFIASWGSSGSGNGQFTHAQDIAVGASDHVYVADTGNNRIEEFTSSGSFIRQWGGQGSGNGQFDQPYGVATDSAGNVYVADTGNGRVQKFDSSGNFLASFEENDGVILPFPTDVTLDSAGNYYTSEFGIEFHGGTYGVVWKHDPSGNLVASRGSAGPGAVLATDPADDLFAAAGCCVDKFSSSGTFITKWGSPGSGIGQFDYATGVAVNSAGNIYVADADNSRIQVFRQSTALPDTTITGPHGMIGDSTPTFSSFSSPDLDATFACKLDSGDYEPCHSPKRTKPLANGPHTFSVRAIDPNGTDPTPAVRSFTLEATDSTAVGVSGSTLVATAALGVRNNIRIAGGGSTLRVTDGAAGSYYYRGNYSGSSVEVGAHCTRTGVSSAECPAAMITRIRVMGQDDGDVIQNRTGIPSSLAGGGGSDNVIGGSGPDTLVGGPSRDYLAGSSGNDLILARDGGDDGVDCDGGPADKADLDKLPKDPNSVVSGCETKTRH